MKDFNIGIIQLSATDDKEKNLKAMEKYASSAKNEGADVICLPEMWNCPYQNSYFTKFAEEDFGETYKKMSEVARKNKVYLIGGSIPIKCGEKIYNRAYVFDKSGREIYKYSKINLFDIEGYKESDTISGGKTLGVFETEYGIFGLAICFDLRFPELFQSFRDYGAEVIFVPSTFMKKTGEVHFHLLNRARAVDTQCYIISPAIARDAKLSKNAYAHSLCVSPSGEIIADLGEEENMRVIKIEKEKVKREREKFPLEISRKNRKL
ncbi:MAG: carbon-nitrogen hydrolase family protein [Peptoniphilus sp.]|uniref:carbon-nitrogen hydrolase family protein n=1 Tax=Peptoniphilus sp. TaxID=1971214 RepID=UPI0025CCA56D|nr:carbon-nitrogen hydrolase family protein [Peptoniphilus sp.]MCI5643774.1 carbon-nitrogen hydrolase family protein [Peptoniphilus sp.]